MENQYEIEQLKEEISRLPRNHLGRIYNDGLNMRIAEVYHKSGFFISEFALCIGISHGVLAKMIKNKKKLRQMYTHVQKDQSLK